MSLTVDQFIRRLVDAQLFTREELNDFIGGLEPRPADGEQLAKELVLGEKLTKYQAQVAYAGDGKTLVLGNYVILDRIGAGGMGEVFLAKHQRLERRVALKTLPAKVTDDETAVRRFHREVQAVAKLSHPNIVGAFDAGESNGTHYCVMEYVAGRDLSSIVRQDGPLPVDLAIRCIMQAAAGLEYAHNETVIHRDIKPANLLLDENGTVKVLDLGLARFEQGDHESVQTELTNTGAVMGTVDYMAPEQAVNTKNADARSDIYSLGCTLFYLLTGRPPYGGETVIEKILAHRDVAIPSLERGGPELDAVFRRMVAKDPGDRYQTMGDVIAALQNCVVAEPAASGAVTASGTDVELQRFLEGVDLPETHAEEPASIQAREPQKAEGSPQETLNIAASGDTFTLGLTRRPKKTLRDHLSNRTVQIWVGSGLALVVAVILFAVSGPSSKPEERPIRKSGGNPQLAKQTKKQRPNDDVIRNQERLPASVRNFALSFDGKESRVDIPGLMYNGDHPLTIEAWVKAEATPGDVPIINNPAVTLKLYGKSGSALLQWINDKREAILITDSAVKIVGRRVHVAGVWTGDEGLLFVDGKLVTQRREPRKLRLTSDRSFQLGKKFPGLIDEVRISKTARYLKEFTPEKRFEPDKDTLGLYHCDEGQGYRLVDASGNGHHGTIHGAAWVKSE